MKAEITNSRQAERVLENLRKGIPPSGLVESFTVGRRKEIDWLDDHLVDDEAYALLLKANYGSGKSHLLELIREKALRRQSAVSLVVLDGRSGVRFNRMDQIFGAILMRMQIPAGRGTKVGMEHCLDFLAEASEKARRKEEGYDNKFWSKVTNDWKWDYSEHLKSAPLFIALRAWAASDSSKVRELVLDWLSFPQNYYTKRKELYETLVVGLRKHFRDPRPDQEFYRDSLLRFTGNGYFYCWSALEDLHRMFVASGYTGMAILFDEFEDVLTNLGRIDYREAAFWNLFRFVSGDRFSGKTFFAVTPSFVEKCKLQLMEKGRWDFDYSQFDDLPTFAMSPLRKSQLLQLVKPIVEVHEIAYDYEVAKETVEEMRSTITDASTFAVQDRARQAIKSAVGVLDDSLE
ncbi:MAG: DUF2791 family P-loop domain-containing protein [Verrucomicrobiales bacterium]|nr:DUF2791 family P-loop domain-containing protein [Verrucomicrobiales bacterium]